MSKKVNIILGIITATELICKRFSKKMSETSARLCIYLLGLHKTSGAVLSLIVASFLYCPFGAQKINLSQTLAYIDANTGHESRLASLLFGPFTAGWIPVRDRVTMDWPTRHYLYKGAEPFYRKVALIPLLYLVLRGEGGTL